MRSAHTNNRKLFSLAALGVVYGDIGTSPLYAFRESLHGILVTTSTILGVLSLILWALILVISINYLIIICARTIWRRRHSFFVCIVKTRGKTSSNFIGTRGGMVVRVSMAI